MITNTFTVGLALDNGNWMCRCIEHRVKERLHYSIDLTPPKSYKSKKIYNHVDMTFDAPSLSFEFEQWQFEEADYCQAVEAELSATLVERLMENIEDKEE